MASRLAAAVTVAVVIAACGGSGGASRSRVESFASATRPTRTVLVLTQTLGFHHASIPWAIAALQRVAAADGRYHVVFLPTAADLTPDALKRAAAVVFLLTSGELPLSPTEKRALLDS